MPEWDFEHWLFWWACTDSPAVGWSHQCTSTTCSPSWHNLYQIKAIIIRVNSLQRKGYYLY